MIWARNLRSPISTIWKKRASKKCVGAAVAAGAGGAGAIAAVTVSLGIAAGVFGASAAGIGTVGVTGNRCLHIRLAAIVHQFIAITATGRYSVLSTVYRNHAVSCDACVGVKSIVTSQKEKERS